MTTTVTFTQQTLHSTKHLPSAVLLNRHVLIALLKKTEAFLAWVNKTAVKNHTLLSEIERTFQELVSSSNFDSPVNEQLAVGRTSAASSLLHNIPFVSGLQGVDLKMILILH